MYSTALYAYLNPPLLSKYFVPTMGVQPWSLLGPQSRSWDIWGHIYLEFEWFAPKTGLQLVLKNLMGLTHENPPRNQTPLCISSVKQRLPTKTSTKDPLPNMVHHCYGQGLEDNPRLIFLIMFQARNRFSARAVLQYVRSAWHTGRRINAAALDATQNFSIRLSYASVPKKKHVTLVSLPIDTINTTINNINRWRFSYSWCCNEYTYS